MERRQQSTRKIIDDLAFLNVSRQRKYQLRKLRAGRCIICGRDAYEETLFCLDHNHKRGIQNPGRNGRRETTTKYLVN